VCVHLHFVCVCVQITRDWAEQFMAGANESAASTDVFEYQRSVLATLAIALSKIYSVNTSTSLFHLCIVLSPQWWSRVGEWLVRLGRGVVGAFG
jgi:hypothetical protein